MLRSLSTGVTGIQQFQEEMDVISNNIANVNTPGYKSARVDFADAFSQTLRGSSGASGTVGATPAMQIGSGVTTSGITNNFGGTGRPATSDPNASFVSFTISPQGLVDVHLSDNTDFTRGQILLQRFSDPSALVKEGLNLFSGIGAAGPLGGASSPTPAAPQTNGLGKIQSGALEGSNVDLAGEFAAMIITQRSFQASARTITTSDEMLQELVNLKR